MSIKNENSKHKFWQFIYYLFLINIINNFFPLKFNRNESSSDEIILFTKLPDKDSYELWINSIYIKSLKAN